MAVTYAKDHFLFTFGGSSAGGDIWQCGVRFATDSSTAPTWPVGGFVMQALYDPVKTAFQASYISSGASLDWVKIALLGKDGHYKTEPQDLHLAPWPGQIGTLASGPQDSVCVSLWSGSTLGKGNHGRFYLPWNGCNVDRGTGRLASTLIPNIVAAWKTALRAIETSINNSGPGSSTVKLYILGPQGSAKAVSHIRVGDVMDTQRRRRNALHEQYFDANY